MKKKEVYLNTNFPHRNLLGIKGLCNKEILSILNIAEDIANKFACQKHTLQGRTQINIFFEASTRTQSSFEIAGKRLGVDVINMVVSQSSIKKGETLIDTAATLNAMRPDLLVVRHYAAGAVHLLSRKVSCAVINAGDGYHEHPTQALLDALTIRRHKGDISQLKIAICGDIAHSRVARSNIILLNTLGAQVGVIAPSTLLPCNIKQMGVDVYQDIRQGLKGVDIVMVLRLQLERMNGYFIPSLREYYRYYGLDAEKLSYAKSNALVMHPGPMNRGVEIDPIIADGPQSLIREQVEMGVLVRMAVLKVLAENVLNYNE